MEEDYRKKEIDPNQLFLLSFLVTFFRCVDSLAAAATQWLAKHRPGASMASAQK